VVGLVDDPGLDARGLHVAPSTYFAGIKAAKVTMSFNGQTHTTC